MQEMPEAREIRPARMATLYVECGDILVTAPAESRVIGRVIGWQEDGGRRSFFVIGPDGDAVHQKPMPLERPVWVHVPRA